jgi:PhzF family phenazine biosynthesis protein
VGGLARALGAPIVSTLRTGSDDVLVELADETTVRGLRPDVSAVERIEARGVVVTAAADPGTGRDFVSRFFAPRIGVDEDPVTGSTHCALAPFWAQRFDRTDLVADQLSERGGRVGVALRGDRVVLRGRAVTVLAGDLRV